MLPGTVVDYRMDYRYFLLASGKASTDLIGNKFQDGKDQENNQSGTAKSKTLFHLDLFQPSNRLDGVVYIEDLIPPARKYYSVKKYFNKLKRVHGDSKEEENQTPNESNTRKGKERGGKRSKKSSKVNSRTQQKIRLENLERAYRRYKDRDYSALSLFRDFQDILGVRYGIQAFWGLAVCHTSSHSKELHEVLRREILKMRFREPTSILSESKPAPYRRGDGGRDDRNNNKNKKKGKGKDNHPFRPQQAKFSRIYKELISEVDEHLLANRKDIPVLDERQLNQAISAFYALEKCDMLQSEKLKMYISPSSREEVQKMFFCPRAKVKEILVRNYEFQKREILSNFSPFLTPFLIISVLNWKKFRFFYLFNFLENFNFLGFLQTRRSLLRGGLLEDNLAQNQRQQPRNHPRFQRLRVVQRSLPRQVRFHRGKEERVPRRKA